MFTPEPVARADFFVNCPKFVTPMTTVTFAMKNYIGIQDDRHRLIVTTTDSMKVADLQHIIQPQFIAIDAIEAGEGRMLTPAPVDLGLIIMGNNSVLDTVCSAIIGWMPKISIIRFAHEQASAPSISTITVCGDLSFKKHKPKHGFGVGLVRVEILRRHEHQRVRRPPPEEERTDYCWGGCPGAIEEAIEILRQYDSECDGKLPRMHVVFGNYGTIDAAPTSPSLHRRLRAIRGEVAGQLIEVKACTKTGRARPLRGQARGHLRQDVPVSRKSRAQKQPYMWLEGCPVSVAEQALMLVSMGTIKNPYFPYGSLEIQQGLRSVEERDGIKKTTRHPVPTTRLLCKTRRRGAE